MTKEQIQAAFEKRFPKVRLANVSTMQSVAEIIWNEACEWASQQPQSEPSDAADLELKSIIEWIEDDILLNPDYANSPRLRTGAEMVKVHIELFLKQKGESK